MKISLKLTLLFLLISVIPLSILSYFSINASKKTMHISIGVRAQNLAEEKANAIGYVIEERISEAKLFSEMSEIKEKIIKSNLSYVDKADDEIQKNIKESDDLWVKTQGKCKIADEILDSGVSELLKKHQKKDPAKFGEIFVTDIKGATVGMTTVLSDYYQADEDWWIKSYNDGKGAIFIDDRGYDESVGAVAIGIVAPVYESGSEKVIGILKINYKVYSILSIVSSTDLFEGGWDVFLASSRKGILVHTSGRYDEKLTSLESSLLAKNKPGWSEDYHGEKEFLMGYATVPITDIYTRVPNPGEIKGVSGEKWEPTKWVLFIDFDKSKALAPVTLLSDSIYYMWIFIVIALAAVAFYSAKFISNPVKKLIEGAEIIGRGNLNHKIGIKKKDEIGQLSNAFDQMSENLKTVTLSRDELKKEVVQRKIVQESLKSLTSRYEATLASIPYIVMEVDTNKVYTWANKAGYLFFGEDVLGKEASYYFVGEQDTYKTVEPVLKGDEKVIYVESLQRRKDGEKRLLAWWSRVLKDTNGNVTGVISTARDITEQKRAEEALKNSEEKLSNITNSARDAIIMIDNIGKVTFWNPAAEKIFGFSSAEVIGKELHNLIIPEKYSERHQKGFAEFRKTGHGSLIGRTVEFEGLRKNGEKFPIEMSLSSVEVADQWHAVGIVRDITERKKYEVELRNSEDQLRQAQKFEAIATLAGGIAHDFNNMLTAIIGYSEMTADDLNEDSKSYNNLKQVLTASYRAKDIVAQLMAYSRKSEENKVPLQIDKLLSETLKLLVTSLPTSVYIDKEIDKDVEIIMANPTQIQQVFFNVCINAVHAMPEGGTLKITLKNLYLDKFVVVTGYEISGAYILINIKDNGIGMDEATKARIFDPFFTTKEVGKGTGLGLSTVFGIVKQHGGYITVDSEKGKGASFNIYLPTMQKDDSTVGVGKPVTEETKYAIFEDKETVLKKFEVKQLEKEIFVNISGNVFIGKTEKEKLLELYVLAKSEKKEMIVNCSNEVQKRLKENGFDKFLEIRVK